MFACSLEDAMDDDNNHKDFGSGLDSFSSHSTLENEKENKICELNAK